VGEEHVADSIAIAPNGLDGYSPGFDDTDRSIQIQYTDDFTSWVDLYNGPFDSNATQIVS
jgi:hypothetical protein